MREELNLLPGPVLADGQPSHTLHDPVRNLFFQLDWATFQVLSRWHLGDAGAILAAVRRDTPLALEVQDLEGVLRFLHENQLLHVPPGQSAELAARLKARRGSLGQRLLHGYLFFRIPLAHPDRWLTRWAPRMGFFFSARFLWLTLAALVLGVAQAAREGERFAATLVDTLTWSGLASYGLALTLVKVLHELGHAFTAKRLGCRVPTMGVAFLVMWPVAYTDTNEVWKLTRRRERLQVAAAGVLTELAIAAWATLAWGLLPEGTAKGLAFLLATTTWVSTLAINASPFMRFDGYFLLADWLEMPNLHARAFALARWDLRERLFGLGEPVPEHFKRRRHAGLVLFAWATWIYRLVVFLGIAALVYTFFIKAVGILLFIVEIGWFVLMPFLNEFKAWRERWPRLKTRRRAWGSLGAAAGLLLLMAVPLPTRIGASALLRPVEQFVVYAPEHAQLRALPVAQGQRVAAGTALLELASPDLDGHRRGVQARLERLRWQASAGVFDAEQRAQWQLLQEQLATAEAEWAAIEAEAARFTPLAPFDGVLRDLDPELRPGDWLRAREPLARLVSGQGQMVVAYLDGEEVARIAPGHGARFYADGLEGPFLPLEVVEVEKDAARTLPEAELSAPHGGTVLVREKQGQLYPEHGVYRVTLKPTGDVGALAGQAWRGKVVIAGDWQAPGWRYLRSAVAVFWREAGF
ncbi:HlyD family efflux transporter periplasmic adaptor subunit [Azohydromonas sp. G-1-1-14]|uniref:HlyD family efflux transporter periplasmic adaptor subunit n=1 Tax=Azohydromonas caseinilytica TaxID=2728836 RepID=A0A848FEM1_9BURK|nr:HlyD family efflux transporter periplasmic adaptor subunit [Azohydromonas caseinilytica]